MSYPEWTPDARSLLNRLVMIIGESGTGKSYLIKHLMHVLAPHVPQIVVFSPTNPQNHTYDANGEVPELFIHTKVDMKALDDIWARQEVMRSVYERANNIEILQGLVSRVNDPEAIEHEKNLRQALELTEKRYKLTMSDEAVAERMKLHREDTKNTLIRVYKSVIGRHIDKFNQMKDLSEKELHTIKYRCFMPRLLIVFDDCTEQLKAGRGSEIMQRIFYKARHLFITTIMACHTDKTFDPELKKQVFVTIFTAPECFSTYIDRASNGLDKQQRQNAHVVKSNIFTPTNPNQKLVWDRNKKTYYRYTAANKPVKFCAPVIRMYAEMATRKGDDKMEDNRFASRFS